MNGNTLVFCPRNKVKFQISRENVRLCQCKHQSIPSKPLLHMSNWPLSRTWTVNATEFTFANSSTVYILKVIIVYVYKKQCKEYQKYFNDCIFLYSSWSVKRHFFSFLSLFVFFLTSRWFSSVWRKVIGLISTFVKLLCSVLRGYLCLRKIPLSFIPLHPSTYIIYFKQTWFIFIHSKWLDVS